MIESSDVENRGPAALSRTKRTRADAEPKTPATPEAAAAAGDVSTSPDARTLVAAEMRRRAVRIEALQLKLPRGVHCGHCAGEASERMRDAVLDVLREPVE